jgi:hypothetical protein
MVCESVARLQSGIRIWMVKKARHSSSALSLPPGVDPARIETYLSTSTFQEKFSMSKADYSASPRWKQIEMKKNAGLF